MVSSKESKLYITVYAKFVSVVEKMIEDLEIDPDDDQAALEFSRKLSKDISGFLKVYSLKQVINK